MDDDMAEDLQEDRAEPIVTEIGDVTLFANMIIWFPSITNLVII